MDELVQKQHWSNNHCMGKHNAGRLEEKLQRQGSNWLHYRGQPKEVQWKNF